mmetsp:Transcript_2614/g.6180  ORF Transcript_2614/g.6180 Transcript_2614/m.6180 type:complete len:326 (+) Transcript_2614:534-1511(+)
MFNAVLCLVWAPPTVDALRGLKDLEHIVHGTVANRMDRDLQTRRVCRDDARLKLCLVCDPEPPASRVEVRLGHERRAGAKAPVRKRLHGAPAEHAVRVREAEGLCHLCEVRRSRQRDRRVHPQPEAPPVGRGHEHLLEVAPRRPRLQPTHLVDLRHAVGQEEVHGALQGGIALLQGRSREHPLHEKHRRVPEQPGRARTAGSADDRPAGGIGRLRGDAREGHGCGVGQRAVLVRLLEVHRVVGASFVDPRRLRRPSAQSVRAPAVAEQPRARRRPGKRGLDGGAEVLAAAGAREVQLRHLKPAHHQVHVGVHEARHNEGTHEVDW